MGQRALRRWASVFLEQMMFLSSDLQNELQPLQPEQNILSGRNRIRRRPETGTEVGRNCGFQRTVWKEGMRKLERAVGARLCGAFTQTTLLAGLKMASLSAPAHRSTC